MRMRWITPEQNQGQMVERSYMWWECYLYQRTYDHSNRSFKYHRILNTYVVKNYDCFKKPVIRSGYDWEECEMPFDLP